VLFTVIHDVMWNIINITKAAVSLLMSALVTWFISKAATDPK